MCGIAGIVAPSGVSPVALRTMANSIRHRGPDDEGYLLAWQREQRTESRWGDDTVMAVRQGRPAIDAPVTGGTPDAGIVSRRLAVIDPTPEGHQPMTAADDATWIAFNGEVYNYLELRAELEAKGHRFRNHTDTEVVLAAYAEWGTRCVERFSGMWAFAILDLRRGVLFCSRDRLGVKPFYYTTEGGRFVFASEIKALLALPETPRTIDQRAVGDFLIAGYSDHTDGTFFAAVRSLPAGHNLEVPLADPAALAFERYWGLPASTPSKHGAAEGALREHLRTAVRQRLRSDVPVGFCLSGGIDSGSIVALAGEASRSAGEGRGLRLRTFTVGLDDARRDERETAAISARAAGAEVSALLVRPEDYAADIAALLRTQDEPFGGPGVYLQYALMRFIAEQGVKVVLDGQGGDELFGGYYRYAGAWLRDVVRTGAWGALARALPTLRRPQVKHAVYQLLLGGPVRSLAHLAAGQVQPHERWLDASFVASARRVGLTAGRSETAPLDEMLAQDLTRWSLPRLLRWEDRNSMAWSVEARVPFADDATVIEFVSALPATERLPGGRSKGLLVDAMRDLLPEPIRRPRPKLGFSLDEAKWAAVFAESEAGRAILATPSPYLKGGSWSGLLASAAHDPRDATLFWRLVELRLWEDVVVRRDPPEGAPCSS